MSEHNFKPGDVALIEAGCWANRKVALRLDEGWAHVNGVNVDGDGVVSPVRPLVVIDPEDREQIARLADAFCTARWSHIAGSDECDPLTRTSMETALREFANFADDEPEPLPDGLVISEGGDLLNWRGENYTRQKVSPPTPPKPEEPTGLGAVVEDADGVRWMSWRSGLDVHERPWQRLEMDTDEFRDYADIAVVTTHFEGVTE